MKQNLNVPLNTQTDFIYNISDILPYSDELYTQRILFIARCANSKRSIICSVAKLATTHLRMLSPLVKLYQILIIIFPRICYDQLMICEY